MTNLHKAQLRAVVLAAGTSTRLWPLTTAFQNLRIRYHVTWVRTEVVLNWTAVAVVSVAIVGLGSDGASSENTSRFIQPLLAWLFPQMSPGMRETVHVFIRKLAHTAEYGVLALLIIRALRVTWTVPLARSVALALGFVLALGAADEGRQAFSSTRQGSIADVFLDVAGACALLAAVQVLPERLRRTLIRTGN